MNFTAEELDWADRIASKWWNKCRHAHHGNSRDDFYVASLLGLWKAKKKYQKREDSTYERFCNLCMRTAIVDWIRTNNPLPRNHHKKHKTKIINDDFEDMLDERDQFEEVEMSDFVRNLLSKLSRLQREVLVRSFFHGQSLEEMAPALHRASPTVGWYKKRAQERCLELLHNALQ